LTTKSQDELLSVMKAIENVELLSLSSPSHWKLQNPECTMLIVSSYKSPNMTKWDFNLVLGLWNQPITNLRFDKPDMMIHVGPLGEGCVNCHFLRGWEDDMWPAVVFIVATL